MSDEPPSGWTFRTADEVSHDPHAAASLPRSMGERYRLPGWSDLLELDYQDEMHPRLPPPPRRLGRPCGSYVITSGLPIVQAYRQLRDEGNGRRPTWGAVAERLMVEERTLRAARKRYGLMTIEDERE